MKGERVHQPYARSFYIVHPSYVRAKGLKGCNRPPKLLEGLLLLYGKIVMDRLTGSARELQIRHNILLLFFTFHHPPCHIPFSSPSPLPPALHIPQDSTKNPKHKGIQWRGVLPSGTGSATAPCREWIDFDSAIALSRPWTQRAGSVVDRAAHW